MTKALRIVLILVVSVFALQAQTFYGTTDLKTFRDGREKEFRDAKESPLKAEDFAKFKGLDYFPVLKGFTVTAIFTKTSGEKFFDMPNSAGQSDRYIKYATLSFRLSNKAFRLNVYRPDPESMKDFPEYKDILLIPFLDLTNKTETYGGGRYINILEPKGKAVTLDFNLAYNPSCSYGSGRYSCPVPPKVNTINLAVTAGEKKFIYTGYEKTH